MATSETTEDRRFPTLTADQLAVVERRSGGAPATLTPGALAYAVGATDAPAWFIVAGTMDIFSHAGLDDERLIQTLGPGQFSGEINQLTGQPTLAGGRAGAQGCQAVLLTAAQVRALVIGSADIGEMVMRAFMLRRAALIDAGSGGPILVGVPNSPDMVRLRGFLARNGFPHVVLDVSVDERARAFVAQMQPGGATLPLVVCADGSTLRCPDDAALAHCIGISPTIDTDVVYDTAIIGAGPSGLAAAVYAASEGLSVVVLEANAIGGQAGASARIENYLGFPSGISGQALAGRAFSQALKFGTKIALAQSVTALKSLTDERLTALTLSDGQVIRARTTVVASGARYRHPPLANLKTFEGRGIAYWASPIEARLCEGEEIALVGGGNSAGQAVAFLAPRVKKLHLVIRRPDLTATMSRYLIDRIASLPNVVLHASSEVSALEGDEVAGLDAVVLRHRKSGQDSRLALRHLFLFIGADPNTSWMDGCVEMDSHGFIVTGAGMAAIPPPAGRLPLETSMSGVFAIGDVRAGSTKRIAAAVGEGAAVIAQIHAAMAARSSAP
ncbi:FAD-dependent oxidoreductase [Mesorhizobium sp. M0134]|uniref:FAD-dependent oxidoreductase n=1 Tax=Mesorhizobium sp. M0134 TaxID=2956889 RepID=UPI003336DC47